MFDVDMFKDVMNAFKPGTRVIVNKRDIEVKSKDQTFLWHIRDLGNDKYYVEVFDRFVPIDHEVLYNFIRGAVKKALVKGLMVRWNFDGDFIRIWVGREITIKSVYDAVYALIELETIATHCLDDE